MYWHTDAHPSHSIQILSDAMRTRACVRDRSRFDSISPRCARAHREQQEHANEGQREPKTHHRGKTPHPRPPFHLVGTTAADGIMRESDSWVYLSIQKVMAERREHSMNQTVNGFIQMSKPEDAALVISLNFVRRALMLPTARLFLVWKTREHSWCVTESEISVSI